MLRLFTSRKRPRVSARGVVRPARDVFAAERDGLVVLLDLRREVYLGLDEVGTVIWRELERGADEGAVAARVAAEFDAPPDQVAADARAFIAELTARQLVVHT